MMEKNFLKKDDTIQFEPHIVKKFFSELAKDLLKSEGIVGYQLS